MEWFDIGWCSSVHGLSTLVVGEDDHWNHAENGDNMVEVHSLHICSKQATGEDHMARVVGDLLCQVFLFYYSKSKEDRVLGSGVEGHDRSLVSGEISRSREVRA